MTNREFHPCIFSDRNERTGRETFHRGEEWEHLNREAIRTELYRLGCTPGLEFPSLDGVPASTNYTFKGGFKLEIVSDSDTRQEFLTLPDGIVVLLWEQHKL